MTIAIFFGIKWIDSGFDRGLHDGLNFACSQIKPWDDDVIIVYDPDSGPTRQGWDMALVTAITKGGYLIASLGEPRAMKELRAYGYAQKTVDGYLKIWEPVRPVVMSVSAFSYGFVRKQGGFSQPLKYYGGLEAAMWEKMQRHGGRWAYLPEYGEENSLRDQHDREYLSYKWNHGHLLGFPGSFQEYLDAGCPNPLPSGKQLP
jgi:hypothetical protein